MQIRPTNQVAGARAINLQTQTQSVQSHNTTSMPVDQLNISAEAQLMSAQAASSDIRADRVADIRAQIASGNYETAEKLDIAVGRMLNEIG